MAQKFTLTELGTKSPERFTKGQPALIYDALLSSAEPISTQDIVNYVGGHLKTRQDPTRVVGFYMSVWKKKGLVSAVDITEAKPAVPTATEVLADELHEDAVQAAKQVEETEHLEAADDATLTEAEVNTLDEPVEVDPFANCATVRDAVHAAVEHDLANVPGHVAQILTERWKPTTVKQASDALRKLAGRGELKYDGTRYSLGR